MENLGQLQEILLTHYNVQASHIEPTSHGMMNHPFIVHSPRGLFVLKHYGMGSYALSDIARGSDMQTFLHSRGLPVPGIMRTVNESTVLEVPDGMMTLSTYMPGQHHVRGLIPTEAAFNMGSVLGLIQSELVDFPRALMPYRHKSPDTAILTVETLLACAQERRGSPIDDIAYQRLLFQREWITRLAALAESNRTHERVQWTHGDYQETNVLFDADMAVTAVVDFDHARTQPRGLELMRALSYSFPVKSEWIDEADAFLRGYFSVVRPPADEVAHYAAQWAYHKVCSFWPIESRYLNPGQYQGRWDTFIAPPSGWWETHVDEVTHRLLQILRSA